MAVQPRYISCGCNKVPHSADFGRNGLIAYCACHAVAIYENPSRVTHTLGHHTDKVNCVRWIKGHEKETEFVSGSTDKTAAVWCQKESKYEVSCILAGHTGSVTAVDAIYTSPTTTLIATTSTDSTIRIWSRDANQDGFECIQTITISASGFALAVSWAVLPESKAAVLAYGGDDHSIHLLVQKDNKFVEKMVLVGHEDWVRDLDFAQDDSGDLLLASCAQDFFIRIWRISNKSAENGMDQNNKVEGEIQLKGNTFEITETDRTHCIVTTLETVLHGHDNWVYSVRWQPWMTTSSGGRHQPLSLLSSSMDKTMFVWQPDPQSGMWMNQVRVGEVGGNTLGFYGGLFSPDGECIVAHGYQGAFHVWRKDKANGVWLPQVTVGGHFAGVDDVVWEPSCGAYLLSVSADQTTRLHAYWMSADEQQSGWHEIARPQIHGYDMHSIAMINKCCFASGAEEKITRVFQSPNNFMQNISRICCIDTFKEFVDKNGVAEPEGASVPALGLSNKAVFEGEESRSSGSGDNVFKYSDQYKENYFSPVHLKEPPTEENLLQNTLWPETQKLYGHGYEIFAMSCDIKGCILATACKASKAEHAGLILWDTVTWRQLCVLAGHSLTVTHVEFSHNGQHILSVSRDRTWCLYKKRQEENSGPLFTLTAHTDKKTSLHSRIIWGCSWSHDDRHFVTVARDKKAVVWGTAREDSDNGGTLGVYGASSSPLTLIDSITAADFAPCAMPDGSYLISFGLDNGEILFYKWRCTQLKSTTSWMLCYNLNKSQAHHMTVKQLRFQPTSPCSESKRSDRSDGSNILMLASCGTDHAVKIHSIQTNELPLCPQK